MSSNFIYDVTVRGKVSLQIDYFSKRTEKVQFLWPSQREKHVAIVFTAVYSTLVYNLADNEISG